MQPLLRIPRRSLLLLLAVLATVIGARVATARGAATPLGTGVVTVSTQLAYQDGAAAGSGMVLSSTGEILTNNHVIAGATSIRVALPGTGRSYTARVVGYSVADDIAVLQLQGASNLRTVSTSTAAVTLGASVKAVGNAGGTGSLTTATGRVTGTNEAITASDDNGSSERLTNLIETDATVQPGDSGGALESSNGRVIGIVTAASSSGRFAFGDTAASRGYAIRIGKALSIASAIEHGRASSTIHIGATAFLGVNVSQVSATGFGNASSVAGAAIVSVVSGGPADRAGLAPGDVITSVAGRTATTPKAITALLVTKHPGARVSVVYHDQTGTHSATVTLGSGPPQ